MWFIGLLAGLLLGAAFQNGDGALWGGLIGALAGAVFAQFRKPSHNPEIESRLAALEATVGELRRQLSALASKASPSAQQVQSASVVPPAEIVPQEITPQVLASQPAAPAAVYNPAESVEPVADTREPEPFAPSSRESWPINRAWAWLTGGNALVRIGVVVLFFGVAFLLKYAYEHSHVPVEVRLIGVAVGAVVMLVIGWRLRASKPVYGLAMQGGGVGLLYLTVFGAFRLFNLIPGEAAFLMLIAIAVFSAVLAVLQNAMSLAVLGASGGFLAPILASTGGGSHVMLFSYYALLNAGVLGIALFKAWRPLNVLGFVFTFGIGAFWGARFYQPELLASTEPFLVLFFLEYVAIAVLFALRQAPQLKHYVDSTIVFGTPLVAFGLQARLIKDIEFGAAWSAVAVAALYLALAGVLYRKHTATLRMLVEAFLALGVIFATLAIPLALGGRWTSVAWALEGAAAYWVGMRQGRRLPRAFGLLMQFAAGIAFVSDVGRNYSEMPLANTFFLGCVFIAAAGLFCSRTTERNAGKARSFTREIAIATLVWGIGWWLFAGLHEIDTHVRGDVKLNAALLFLAGTCAAFSFLRTRGWVMAGYPALALAPLMILTLLANVVTDAHQHPFAASGWLAWPVAFAIHWRILLRHDGEDGYRTFAHAASVWLLAAIGAWEVGWQIDRLVEGNRVWPLIAWALVPGGLVALLGLKGLAIKWPVLRHARAYLWVGAAPVAVFVLGWTAYANLSNDGNPAPLPYVPLLNPLDIAQLLAFAALAMWWRTVGDQKMADVVEWPRSLPRLLIGIALFLFLNGVLLRTLHHWADVPYQLDAMLRSDLVQAALSIFWTVLALVAMVAATRLGLRVLWSCGAALMGVVVVKLFIMDLAKLGGVERIVSFIAVGILMLVIGYFSPLPPKQTEQS
jgi:uncharacterized membrane protein